ncbi:MAG: terminase family protein [Patescibacteria group bacterium]|nr:terminase family protein [Patescibacteria group bacterium]MDE2227272.1 terminase family protein [Patescibacteria group bacterium]
MKLDKFKLFDLIGYKVHHRNIRRFHESDARIKVAVAPRRTSKSYSAAHDGLDVCLMPNTRTWIVGPSYSLAEKEFRYIHDVLVIKREKLGLPKPVSCMTNARSGQLYIKWPWGAVVEGKTADRPESLLGDAVDRVIYSEAAQLPRAIHERYVAPTLITKKGTCVIATTPDSGAEWVYELYQAGVEGLHEGIESFTWDISANPEYPVEEFEKAKKLYGADSPAFREQYMGEWVFYSGLVYNTFNKDLHVIEPFDIPQAWPRIRGIDFGHRDPFVCLWCAVGPSGELYFYREYHNREGLPMKQHASIIKEKSVGENITQTVADSESSQSIDDLCSEGIPAFGADKKREEGRLKVLEYMMPTDDGTPPFPFRDTAQAVARNKWPRMYFFNTMKETLREIKFFRWKEGRKVEGDREKTEGEDHCMDTMRYIVNTRPSPFVEARKIPAYSFNYYLNKLKSSKFAQNYIGA